MAGAARKGGSGETRMRKWKEDLDRNLNTRSRGSVCRPDLVSRQLEMKKAMVRNKKKESD